MFSCRKATLRKCFRQFDTNGDGIVERHELKNVLLEARKLYDRPGHHLNMPEDVIDGALKGADTDTSGAIDYEEFLAAAFGIK